jgi:predicted porin
MKKHLIAAAVAAAVAVPAMAQNVTMDGVFDQMYGAVDAGGTAADRGNYFGGVRNTFSTSQMNIRGTEDLGGGIKAAFRLSRQFNALTGRDTVAGWNEASVAVSGDFGTINMGLQDIAGKEGFGYGRFGNFGRTAGALYAMGDERPGVINYMSPRMSGLQIVFGTATATASGDPAAGALGKTSGLGVSFEGGPLKVGLNMARGDSGGTNTGEDQAFAASYNAGVATVAVSYLTHDRIKQTEGKLSNTLVSASVPMGSGLNLMIAYLKYKDSTVAAGTGNTATGYQLALTKDLSKRTMVYAAYANLDNEAGVNYGMRGNGTAAAIGEDPTAFGIGLRHSF